MQNAAAGVTSVRSDERNLNHQAIVSEPWRFTSCPMRGRWNLTQGSRPKPPACRFV